MRFSSAYTQLTPTERAFVDAIVAEMQAVADRAERPLSTYLREGFEAPPQIAARDSRQLLTRERVRAATWERLTDLARSGDLTQARWERAGMARAFSNIRNYIKEDDDGRPYFDLTRCTPEEMSAIKSLKIKQGGRRDNDSLFDQPAKMEIEITLHDPLPYWKTLGESAGYVGSGNMVLQGDRQAPPPRVTQTDSVETAGERYAAMLEDGQ